MLCASFSSMLYANLLPHVKSPGALLCIVILVPTAWPPHFCVVNIS